ncbi:inositol monophosphatase family protein [Jeotgalicoccus sp. WY2]|uniref:inositol monophosphatase family protein n=1 Tax=Jeotgalicoccus sp. WY2 TaxID=2708346 RepID=UPI002111DC6A|nr:inositol monophosphatase family protein [Jeotgalicoccus sp. WY2]
MAKSRSVRSYGSAALEFAMLARGQISALLFFKLYPWDYTGGEIITGELGYKTTDLWRKLPLLSSTSVISGNPKIHSEILEHFTADTNYMISMMNFTIYNNTAEHASTFS